MSATADALIAWPTADAIQRVMEASRALVNEVDQLPLMRLVDSQDAWEKPKNVELPTFEDVGVLAWAVGCLSHELGWLQDQLERMEQAMRSAGYWAAIEQGRDV
jgi:hypothetical protein